MIVLRAPVQRDDVLLHGALLYLYVSVSVASMMVNILRLMKRMKESPNTMEIDSRRENRKR